MTHPDRAAEERACEFDFPLGGGGRGHLRAGLPLLLPHAVPVHAATTHNQSHISNKLKTAHQARRLGLLLLSNQIPESYTQSHRALFSMFLQVPRGEKAATQSRSGRVVRGGMRITLSILSPLHLIYRNSFAEIRDPQV